MSVPNIRIVVNWRATPSSLLVKSVTGLHKEKDGLAFSWRIHDQRANASQYHCARLQRQSNLIHIGFYLER